jgi:hypothetical protein
VTYTIRVNGPAKRTLFNGLRHMRTVRRDYTMSDVIDRMISENQRMKQRITYLEFTVSRLEVAHKK